MFFVGFLLGGFNDEPFFIFSFIFNSFGFALTCGVPCVVFAIIDYFVSEYEEIANKTATQLIVILIAVLYCFSCNITPRIQGVSYKGVILWQKRRNCHLETGV